MTISTTDTRPARRFVTRTAAAALLLSSAALALDAAHAQDSATWLDTLTVVGTRTQLSVQDNPASVTVLDEEQLARKAPESVAEMLRDVPGVEVVDSSAAGMKRIRIRGESSRRVTILVDGQEITDHSTFGTPILIDPSNIERIDVVRGPASVLHGAKAIGGVVNIITKRGADKPVEAEIGGSYYSATGGWQGWAAVAGTIDNFDYRFSAGLDKHGDRHVAPAPYAPGGVLDGTAFSNDNLSLHMGYRFGEAQNHYIAVKADQHRLATESWTDPATLVFPIVDFNIDLPKRDRRKIGIFYDGTDLGPVVRNVHLNAYYQTIDRLFSNNVVMRPLPPMTVGVTSTSEDRILNYGGTAQVDLQLHPDHYTIVGLNYLTDTLRTDKSSTTSTRIAPRPATVTRTESLDDASIHTVSAFAQNEWSFAPDFSLTTGLRYYHTESVLDYTSDPARKGIGRRSDDRVVTSAGLTYTGIADTTLRALYSEGYIMPTLLQSFTDTTAGRGSNTFGNPNLSPETSRNVEIGARYNAGGIVFDASAFYTHARDYITSIPCTSAGASCRAGATAADYIHVNADAATTYGIELAAEYAVPGTAFTPYVNGAWMRRKLDFAAYSTYDSNTPAFSGRLGVRWDGELAGSPVWADLYLRAASGVSLASLDGGAIRVEKLPAWGTLNVAFGGTLGADNRFRYSVGFNNILNQSYRASFDELPGAARSIEISASMKF